MSNPSGLSPMEYNVVIQLDPPEEASKTSLILPDSVKDTAQLAMDEGTLVALSPHAFTYAEWPEGARKPTPGDRVLFSRYAGALHERGGHKFRVIKDQAIIAVIEPPSLAAVA